MNTHCKVGDLAVVVKADNPTNLGIIVRVVELHDGNGFLAYPSSFGTVWLCEGRSPMTWHFRGRWIVALKGPIPDSQLQPIRGDGTHETGNAASVVDYAESVEGSAQ